MNNGSLINRFMPNREAGFSLVELMIGMVLGLLILAGLITVFVQSNQTRSEIERNNRQIESGRYAMSLLTEDLRMAGYFGTFDPYQTIIKPNGPPLGGASPITTMPDPCNATLTGNASSWDKSYFFHIQGIDNAATIPGCLTDVKTGTDIVVIRRASACVAGPTAGASCDAPISGVPYFQASNCYQPGELATNTGATSASDYLSYFVLNTDTSATVMNKHAINCTTMADYSRYLVRIYFVANNNAAGDNVPTLKRAELGATGFTIVPLVEGIENLQIEYGVDKDGDGVIDAYTADPGIYNGCTGASCVVNWLSTYSVSVNILARNTEPTIGFSDAKTYKLGQKADGTDNTFGPYGDPYKRHVYNSAVRLDNPAGRRTP